MAERYAVMGYPVSHSKSPYIHGCFAAQTGEPITYEAIEVEPGRFPDAVRAFRERGGQGLNVTLPFKQEAFNLAQVRTDRAERAGAVNTLWFDEHTGINGDNTDGIGLIRDLAGTCGVSVTSSSVLLIGAGGAARGAACALLDEGPHRLVVANRSHHKAVSLAQEMGVPDMYAAKLQDLEGEHFELVVNATAASIEGKVPPIPTSIIDRDSVCYDMMYAVEETAFVRWSRDNGARCAVDGLGMLVEQAAESFALWRKVKPNATEVLRALRSEIKKTSNETGR